LPTESAELRAIWEVLINVGQAIQDSPVTLLTSHRELQFIGFRLLELVVGFVSCVVIQVKHSLYKMLAHHLAVSVAQLMYECLLRYKYGAET